MLEMQRNRETMAAEAIPGHPAAHFAAPNMGNYAALRAGFSWDQARRDQIDIDSMDFLSFLIALHREFRIDIPESDAGKRGTIDACADYPAQTLRRRAKA